jgi:hypothetical protein
MIKQQSGYVKTWRMISNDTLTRDEIDYLIEIGVNARIPNTPINVNTYGKTYQYAGPHQSIDVITISDEQESMFLLRFAGRFALLHVTQINTAWHSFTVS